MGDEIEWHTHVLISFEWHVEVEIFDVSCRKPGPGGVNEAIPIYVGSGNIGSARGEFKRAINQITADYEVDLIGVFLVGSVIHNDAGILYRSIGWDVFNFI